MDIDERLQEHAEQVSSPHDPPLAELSDATSSTPAIRSRPSTPMSRPMRAARRSS
jgi:hypothetical protein